MDIKKLLSLFLKIVKFIILAPLEVAFAGVSIMFTVNMLQVAFAMFGEGVYRPQYIFKELFMALFSAGIAFLILRALMNEKLKKFTYSKILMITAGCMAGAVAFTMLDESIVNDFKYRSYPSYILDWPTQVVTQTVDCDYSRDVIYLSGYFNFMDGGFREYANVEVTLDENSTESYRVEIRYKGKKSEMYIYHDEYDNHGEYMDNINIWPEDYDYDMTTEDIVHMYKHGEDLRYAEPLVIEKITIYTAYPEKFDLSQINI